jgi:hypothetical protein
MSRKRAHAETWANMIAGQVLAQTVLYLFGLPWAENFEIGAAMFVVSYARTYTIRRAFQWFEGRKL